MRGTGIFRAWGRATSSAGRVPARRLSLLLVAGLLAGLILPDPAHAMPAARTGDGQPQPIRDGFSLGRFSDEFKPEQLVVPYDDLFSMGPQQDNPMLQAGGGAGFLSLSAEEQAEVRALLDPDPQLGFTSPFLEGGVQVGVNTPETDPLARQLVREVDALYDELRSAATSPLKGFGTAPGTFGDASQGPGTGDSVLAVVQAQRAGDLPVLSALPLGAMFKDAVRDSLDATGVSRDTIDGLRDFVLVEERRTGSMMMVDGGSGYSVTLRSSEDVRAQDFRTANGFDSNALAAPALPETVEGAGPRPLHWKIWDVLTSAYAFIVYGVLLICWASWRYVISRYA